MNRECEGSLTFRDHFVILLLLWIFMGLFWSRLPLDVFSIWCAIRVGKIIVHNVEKIFQSLIAQHIDPIEKLITIPDSWKVYDGILLNKDPPRKKNQFTSRWQCCQTYTIYTEQRDILWHIRNKGKSPWVNPKLVALLISSTVTHWVYWIGYSSQQQLQLLFSPLKEI